MTFLSQRDIRALFFLLIFTGFAFRIAEAQVRLERSDGKIIWNVAIDGIDFSPVEVEGNSFLQARLRGVSGYEGVFHQEGRPELPVVRFWVDGEGEISVDAASDQTNVALASRGPGLIKPALPSVPKVPGARPKLVFDRQYYLTSKGDQKVFEVADIGTIRGLRRRLVTLYPFRYSPATQSGSLTLQFRVSFERKHSAESQASPLQETFAFVVTDKLVESPALQRYRTLKQSLGYTVKVLSIAAADAKPETIRSQLRDLYESSNHTLEYALLVGTQATIPGFASSRLSGVTDHYYRCLDTADYEKDIATPDIGVGRLSVENETQLTTVIDRLISYQRGQFANEDWLKRISFIASDDETHWMIAEGTHDYAIQKYTGPRGYSGSFPDNSEAGGDELYAITYKAAGGDVMNQLRLGRGIVNYGGHGGPDEWVGPHLSIADINSLTNMVATPFVVANACQTADFRQANSIGEAWQRSPGGAMAYFGSMDFTYWDEDDIFERRLYDGIFQDGLSRLEDIGNFARSEVWKFYGGEGRSNYYSETYNLLGDPSIDLRTWITRPVAIWGPAIVRSGIRQVSLQVVDDNHVPVAGARVALSSDSYDYRVASHADPEGRVTLPLGQGTRFTVTALGPNLRMASRSLRVREEDSRMRR